MAAQVAFCTSGRVWSTQELRFGFERCYSTGLQLVTSWLLVRPRSKSKFAGLKSRFYYVSKYLRVVCTLRDIAMSYGKVRGLAGTGRLPRGSSQNPHAVVSTPFLAPTSHLLRNTAESSQALAGSSLRRSCWKTDDPQE